MVGFSFHGEVTNPGRVFVVVQKHAYVVLEVLKTQHSDFNGWSLKHVENVPETKRFV